MFKAICVAAVLGTAASLCIPAANAAVVDVVITGFLDTEDVRNVVDTDNYWNGAFVGGAAFTASYTYDTSVGVRGTAVNGSPADLVYGSADDSLGRGVPVSASLTVGSETRAMASNPSYSSIRDDGSAFVQPSNNPGGLSEQNWAVYNMNAVASEGTHSAGGWLRFDILAVLGTLPNTLDVGYSLTADPDAAYTSAYPQIYGYWYFGEYDSATGLNPYSAAFLRGDSITATVRVPDPSPVPLPAALPLLAVALAGMTGLRLRRSFA